MKIKYYSIEFRIIYTFTIINKTYYIIKTNLLKGDCIYGTKRKFEE